MFNKIINFFTQSSAAAGDAGSVSAVTAAAGSTTLAKGLYKIAAMDADLLWRLGATDVTNVTGSFLAAGDQEILVIEADDTKLSWIRTASASDDGSINIVPVKAVQLPGGDLRNY